LFDAVEVVFLELHEDDCAILVSAFPVLVAQKSAKQLEELDGTGCTRFDSMLCCGIIRIFCTKGYCRAVRLIR
jgi:hypothetical protein